VREFDDSFREVRCGLCFRIFYICRSCDRGQIIHSDRNIGDTAELIPGGVAGARGPLKEILRTQGEDEEAQFLTLTVAGPPTYGSSLATDSSEPCGLLFAVVEWGIKGARSTVELDIPPRATSSTRAKHDYWRRWCEKLPLLSCPHIPPSPRPVTQTLPILPGCNRRRMDRFPVSRPR